MPVAEAATPVAWSPGHELDPGQWAAAGRRIGAVGRCIQWLLGDWIAYGNARFGERYSRASKITGYDTQTLMNMVYVAGRYEASRRRENLSWSHHETLASMGGEEQEYWLDQVAANRWSVADLRMMLRTSRRAAAAGAGEGDPDHDGELLVTPDGEDTSLVCPQCGYTLERPHPGE